MKRPLRGLQLILPAAIAVGMAVEGARLVTGAPNPQSAPVSTIAKKAVKTVTVISDDAMEAPFGFRPVLAPERVVREPQHELREQVLGGQEAFDAMTLDALRIDLEDRRRPLRAETLPQSPELFRLLLHVHAHGKEALFDEVRDPFIGIDLGIQPGTPRSHRRRAEIEEQPALLALRLLDRRFRVASPVDHHDSLLVPGPTREAHIGPRLVSCR